MRERPRRIGLVVDHPRRDLEGILLVARALARRGAEAVVLPLYTLGIDAPLAGLDTVVFNYARRNNVALIRSLKEAGLATAVLDTEGYLTGGHASLLDSLRDSDSARWLDGYLVWGAAPGEAIAAADPRMASKLAVTGCPRFDYLTPRWRGLFDYPRDGHVLVNANFNAVNPAQGDRARERAVMIGAGWDPAYIGPLLDDMERVFPAFLDSCRALAARLPERHFVVRPHPFEAQAPYRERFAGLANVTLDSAGSIFPALTHASMVVHLNCNTAVEARMAALPAVQMDFLNTARLRDHQPLYSDVSLLAESAEDLAALVGDDAALAARDHPERLYERFVKPCFHLNDGRAAERVAERLLALPAPDRPLRSLRLALRSSRPGFSARRAAWSLAGLAAGSRAAEGLRSALWPRRRAKAVAPERVRAHLARLTEIDGGPPLEARRLRGPQRASALGAILIRAA